MPRSWTLSGRQMTQWSWWRRFDWLLAAASLLLVAIGLLMIASLTLGTEQPYFTNQLLFAFLGLTLVGVVVWLGYDWLVQWAWVWYGVVLALLIFLALFGQITRGAAGWIDLGYFSLQPSEFGKVALVLVLVWLVRRGIERGWNQWQLFGSMLAALLPMLLLILLQPDLGTATLIGAAWLVAVWMSPVNKRVLLTLFLLAAVSSVLLWLLMQPYQRERLITFLQPTANPLGSGYNVLQSMIAVGSGQLFGQGWGRGTQSHLNFLPEHHTDFIFASLSEELGFVGAIAVLGLFGIVLWRGVRIAWSATDRTAVILVCALVFTLLFQASVNMAMNVGIAPVTGITLPLVSYGGSSLLTTMLMIGVLQSVALAQSGQRRRA